MHVEKLFLMQDGFRRSTSSLESMIEFVSDGGFFNPQTLSARASGRAALIVLNRFEDQRYFVHDGLHRVASIFLGRDSGLLDESEYRIQEYSYQEYEEINLEQGYVTPFDPRQEVRVADLAEFKAKVGELIESEVSLLEFIEDNKSLYVRSRQPHHDSIQGMLSFFYPELSGCS